MLDYTEMQMRNVNREKGYSAVDSWVPTIKTQSWNSIAYVLGAFYLSCIPS